MASRISKRIVIQRNAIGQLKTPKEIAEWLDKLVKALDKWTEEVYDHIENGGLGTPNWNIREATAVDVVDDNAKVAGNLIIEHKVTGNKREFEA